jgi:AmmeMemoRadiSam system protein B
MLLYRLDITIIPILVGAINKSKETAFGELLAPYLAAPDTFFVISSDFCHWYVYPSV